MATKYTAKLLLGMPEEEVYDLLSLANLEGETFTDWEEMAEALNGVFRTGLPPRPAGLPSRPTSKSKLRELFDFPKNSLKEIREGFQNLEWEEVVVALGFDILDNIRDAKVFATKDEVDALKNELIELIKEAQASAVTSDKSDDVSFGERAKAVANMTLGDLVKRRKTS